MSCSSIVLIIQINTTCPFRIFSGFTARNKFFYIGFADSYFWMMMQIRELYARQENGPEVTLTDMDDEGFDEVTTTRHHVFFIWHINKKVTARATKSFLRVPIESKPGWTYGMLFVKHQYWRSMNKQACGEPRLTDPARIREHRDSVFELFGSGICCQWE